MRSSEKDNSGRTTSGRITLVNNPGRSSSSAAQLDLFKGGPNAVVWFPLHRRADMVRKIAAALDCRSHASGRRYWFLHVRQERAKLERQGLKPHEIDTEIGRYATAISRILHLPKQYGSTPDSAA